VNCQRGKTMKSRSLLAAGTFAVGVVFAGLLAAPPATAKTFKYANQGDALSMDPHSLNESLQLNFTANIYEPLVGRGKKLELIPVLATDWKQTSPTVWRFNLRKGVQFHDGTPLPGGGGQGQFNLGSYSNAKVDELTKAIAIETNLARRNAMIREAM
jgi:ABC-type transport system substrate-binding protein